MVCTRVGTAIVCGPKRKPARCACGALAPLLCDWKVPERKSGTCDKPICNSCATSPRRDKDLCPAHAADYEEWRLARL